MIFKDSISVYVSYNIDIPISWHVAHQEWQDQVMEANFVRTIILFSSDCARILFEVFTFGQAIRSKPLNGAQVDARWLLPPIRGKAAKLSWWRIPSYMVDAWKNTNATVQCSSPSLQQGNGIWSLLPLIPERWYLERRVESLHLLSTDISMITLLTSDF
jgi:hypothetical protein